MDAVSSSIERGQDVQKDGFSTAHVRIPPYDNNFRRLSFRERGQGFRIEGQGDQVHSVIVDVATDVLLLDGT